MQIKSEDVFYDISTFTVYPFNTVNKTKRQARKKGRRIFTGCLNNKFNLKYILTSINKKTNLVNMWL